MKSNLILKFKKGKVYTADGVNFYRFLAMTTCYLFEKVEFHEKSKRYITTHNLVSYTANTAALLVDY